MGRRGELAVFRETFARNPEEVDFPYLFHVHGNGGVGKSTLVRQWETTAREQPSVFTAFVDDEVHDALEAMETISAGLGRQGHSLKRFEKQLATYRQRRHQAESTVPAQEATAVEASAGEPVPASPSSTVAAQVGLVGLGMLPGIGAFAGAVDPGQVALGADRMRTLLNTRLRSHDDVQLVMNPLAKLTPVFLEDLAEVAERVERVVLFFDVYERTGPVLDAWLRSIVFTEDHGTLPVDVQIVLAGRSRLDPRVWGDHLGQVTEVRLDVFTEDEARTLLATHGVTGEETVELVLRLSGRLPLLVDMLARGGPTTSDTVVDPSETAVERFLKWEPDPARREAAQACALPLQLDEDIYQAAVPESAVDGYPWLRALAFVSRQAGRCRYHDVVRDTMLRLQRTRSPSRWQQQHTRLADTFGQWRQGVEAGLGTDTDAYWDDTEWREHRLNETYHRLCANPRIALPDALLQTVQATDHDTATLRRWAQALGQAGHDTDAPALTTWGERLEAAAEQQASGIAALTLLLTAPELTTETRVLAHSVRARDHRVAGDYDSALADYATAHRLAPDTARAHAGRGETYRLMERYDEALTHFNRAIELDSGTEWFFHSRGDTYSSLGRYDEALTDLTRAIELDPQADWAVASRGVTYRLMKRYDEALTDFSRAIELNPDDAWNITSRGLTHRFMKRNDEALADYDRAIDLDPTYAWAIINRAETYRLVERYDEALADYDRAIELDPQADWAITGRGRTYQSLERYDEAVTDFNRAIELDPNYEWAIVSRGVTYRLMKRYDEALTDFNRAIELNPQADWALTNRAETYRHMKRYDEALTDYDRAIELNPQADWALTNRAKTYHALRRYDEALTDYNHVIGLNPEADWAIANRAMTYQALERYDEALTDYNRAIELDPTYAWAIANRGETYRALERYDEALTDFDRAIELDPTYAWAIASRGETYRLMERYDEALADYNRAIELDPTYAWAIASRGQTHRALKLFDEALTDFNNAIELNPQGDWAIANRAMTYQAMERYDEALTDYNRAIELDPTYAWAIANRGETYRLMERYDEALTDYNRAIELDPDDAWDIASRGQTYQAMGRHHEALVDFTQAIELGPEEDWVVCGRGETYRALGRYDEALTDFDRAIELDREDGWFLYQRAMTHRSAGSSDGRGDLLRAVELLKTSAQAPGPRGAGGRADLVVAYCAMRCRAEADDALRVFLELSPSHSGFRELLSDLDELMRLDPATREQVEQHRERLRQVLAASPPLEI
ncbi:hypothetical protein GCM10011583_09370 [Streptomyces camponoticapitis]|uniref:Tetratricopeptide repeat protein n=1 Tax=Streptomyces camponoticapitis TaxID=1616125 RepID=A0ABQ2DZ24_9ACTN|nr:tetratricopeptide repeat protein [Streptomyces camponoticapitis]GGJ79847.1 hypothetical protein GCM10011583_09370 [Streptomyces camponoticapitis]